VVCNKQECRKLMWTDINHLSVCAHFISICILNITFQSDSGLKSVDLDSAPVDCVADHCSQFCVFHGAN